MNRNRNDFKSLQTGLGIGNGLFNMIIMWLSWTGFIFTRRKFGARFCSMNYFIPPALFILFEGAFRFVDLGFTTVVVPKLPSLFYLHMWACILLGGYHHLRMFIRERKGIVTHSYYAGKPWLLSITSLLPFHLSENRVKRFVEPAFVLLIGALVGTIESGYGTFLELVATAMFMMANIQHRFMKARLWDLQDAEIESDMLMATKETDTHEQVFDAFEGRTYSFKELVDRITNDDQQVTEASETEDSFNAV